MKYNAAFKCLLLVLAAGLLAGGFSRRLEAAGPSPEPASAEAEASLAAAEGLDGFLAGISPAALERLGLSGGGLKLGEPYRLYKIAPADLSRHMRGNDISPLLKETGMWHVPVLVGNEIKGLLVLDRVAGALKTVSLGYPELAAQTGKIRSRWGRAAKIIAVFQAGEVLFNVPGNVPNLTPIPLRGSAVKTFSGETLQDPAVTLARLKAKADRNIRGEK